MRLVGKVKQDNANVERVVATDTGYVDVIEWFAAVGVVASVCGSVSRAIGRAFGSFGCLAHIQGKKVAIFAYEIEKQEHNAEPGDVVDKTESTLTVAATDGFVKLTKFMIIER